MPHIALFGGMSGIVVAVATFVCLRGLEEGGAWRRLCAIVLAVLTAKLAAEAWFGVTVGIASRGQDFLPVPESHLVGAATAVAAYAWSTRVRHRRSSAPEPGRERDSAARERRIQDR
jgi:hypothetical protein